jgi:hypothetical protein
MMRSTENWKLDRPLAEKCMGDVVKLCQDVPPGQVHDCLRKHEDQLSADCRQVSQTNPPTQHSVGETNTATVHQQL